MSVCPSFLAAATQSIAGSIGKSGFASDVVFIAILRCTDKSVGIGEFARIGILVGCIDGIGVSS